MPNIRDVARRAGVAPITVSRVVNRSGYVTSTLRERVEAAITELGYVPNTLARSLRSRRTHTLALLVTDITNPFFTTIARGVEDAASAAGFMLVLCNTDEQATKEQAYLQMLLRKRIDGVLLVPAGDAQSLHMIQQQGIPVVVLDRRIEGSQVDVVRCNSEGGAYELGRLLISYGHRRVAVLAGPQGVSTAEDRVRGFQRAMAESGIEDQAQIYYGDFTQKSGSTMTQQALSAHPQPTAFFAANNFLAIGALNALHTAGFRVPEDIALVGFDDLPPALLPFPFLTVAYQPAYEMGRRAVQLLLDRIEKPSGNACQEIVLDCELIVRRSSGDPLAR